jgi:hypothetical protein
MSLVEIVRYSDVYEADLAAAFLESHDIRVMVTERHQTTIDPLMQRALGIRIMVAASNVEAARTLLARAQAGEFAEPEGDDIEATGAGTRATTTLMALAAFATGGFWGTSLPRRLRAPSWKGMLLSALLFSAILALVLVGQKLILDPP